MLLKQRQYLIICISPGSIAGKTTSLCWTLPERIDSIGHFTLSEELEPEVRTLAEQHTLIAGEAVHIARTDVRYGGRV